MKLLNTHNGISDRMRILNDLNLEYITKIQIKHNLAFSDAKILDIGVGGGYFAEKFIRINNKVEYTGVDIENYLHKDIKKRVKFFKADLNHLADINTLLKCNKKYNYIFIFDVLEHLIYFHFVLENIHKILSQKGRLIISVPIDINLSTKIKMILMDNAFSNPFLGPYGHINLFSFRQLETGLKSIKTLEVIDTRRCGLGYGLYDKPLHLNILANISPMLCGRVYFQLSPAKLQNNLQKV